MESTPSIPRVEFMSCFKLVYLPEVHISLDEPSKCLGAGLSGSIKSFSKADTVAVLMAMLSLALAYPVRTY
jgi:hypothetical protein